ncbi:MAG TPA: hypothetical protein VGM90_35995 [Kofleriaceae bacterium]
MQGLRVRVLVLTAIAACGSQPTGQKSQVAEPPVTLVAQPPADSAPPSVMAEEPPPPRLACPAGTTMQQPPAPEPTWTCSREDGVRNGPFVTVFPDDSVEISGTYVSGQLDGKWERHATNGAIVEDGEYAAGQKIGTWTQRSATGVVLGTYAMKAGTGVEKQWYETGALYSERAVKKGVLHGNARWYGLDGAVTIIAKYDNGKLDGPHVFGSKQSLRVEEVFDSGVRRDKRSIWVQGALVAEENYDARGRMDGAYASWRNKKVMRAQGTWASGKRTGLWTWFDRANNKEREGSYIDGKRDGTWSEWWEGKLTYTGMYLAGKPEGDFIYYDRSGKELGRYNLKGGTGTILTFHPNRKPATRQYVFEGVAAGIYQELTPLGKVVVEGRYRGDAKYGSWKEWTPDGVPTLEDTYKRGKLDGVVRKYIAGKVATEATYKEGKVAGGYTEFRDGKPALTGQYVDDRKDGTWTTYSAEGNVLLTATYKDGVLDGPWRQLIDGAVLEGAMVAGRRSGTWSRTDQAGAVTTVSYNR